MTKEMASRGGWMETVFRISPWAGAAALLLLPLIGMRVSNEVVWTASDFAIAGFLLFGTALLFELAMRAKGGLVYRAGAALGLGASLFLVWAILAVGVIGDSGDSADLMYGVVLGIGLVGAAASRLQPAGMARTLFAMASAQAFIGLIAVIGGLIPPYNSAAEIIGITGLFVLLFTLSALLFQQAARKSGPA